MKRLFKNRMFASVLLSVVLTFMFVFAVAYSATTISTSINTGGTLAVSGTSALTGAVTITGLTTMNGNASTTILSTTGNLLINGWATTTGSNGNIATEGTLYITSSTTLAGLLNVGTTLNVMGSLGVSTSTPAAEISAYTANATTTLYLDNGSTGATKKGGCIQMKGFDGVQYRLYATSGLKAVFEANKTCKDPI